MSTQSASTDEEMKEKKTEYTSIPNISLDRQNIFHYFYSIQDLQNTSFINEFMTNFIEKILEDTQNYHQLKEISKPNLQKYILQIKKSLPAIENWIGEIIVNIHYQQFKTGSEKKLSLNSGHFVKLLHTIILISSLYDAHSTSSSSYSTLTLSSLVEFISNSVVKQHKYCFQNDNPKNKQHANQCKMVSCLNQSINGISIKKEKESNGQYKSILVQDGEWCNRCSYDKRNYRSGYQKFHYVSPLIAGGSITYCIHATIYGLWHAFLSNIVFDNRNEIDIGHWFFYVVNNLDNESLITVLLLLLNKNMTNKNSPPSLWCIKFHNELHHLLKRDPKYVDFVENLFGLGCMEKFDLCFNAQNNKNHDLVPCHSEDYSVEEVNGIYDYFDEEELKQRAENINIAYCIDDNNYYFGNPKLMFVSNDLLRDGIPSSSPHPQSMRDHIFNPNNIYDEKLKEYEDDIQMDDTDHSYDYDGDTEMDEQERYKQEFHYFQHEKYNEWNDNEITINRNYHFKQEPKFIKKFIQDYYHRSIKDGGLDQNYIKSWFKPYKERKGKRVESDDSEDEEKHHDPRSKVSIMFGNIKFKLRMRLDKYYPSRVSQIISFTIKAIDKQSKVKINNIFNPQCNVKFVQEYFLKLNELWFKYGNDIYNNKLFLKEMIKHWSNYCHAQIGRLNDDSSGINLMLAIPTTIIIDHIMPYLFQREWMKNGYNELDHDKLSKFYQPSKSKKVFYQQGLTKQNISRINKTFYFATKPTCKFQLTLTGKKMVSAFWSEMPSVRNNNNNTNVSITENDLWCFLSNLYSSVDLSCTKDNNINHHSKIRAHLLIRKYGYYHQTQQKYLMVHMQFVVMYLDLFINEPYRISSELCMYDGQHMAPNVISSIPSVYDFGNGFVYFKSFFRRLLFISKSKTKNGTYFKDDYNNNQFWYNQRLLTMGVVDFKFKKGNYLFDGTFLCENCYKNHIGHKCTRLHREIFEIILQIVVNKPEYMNDNVKQLFKMLQYMLTNGFDDDAQQWFNCFV